MKTKFVLIFILIGLQKCSIREKLRKNPVMIHHKMVKELSKKMTSVMELQRQNYHCDRYLRDDEINYARQINVHSKNPVYGIIQTDGGYNFSILHHAFKNKKGKISFKPQLDKRYEVREPSNLQMQCIIYAKIGKMIYISRYRNIVFQIDFNSNCKDVKTTKFFQLRNASPHLNMVVLSSKFTELNLKFEGSKRNGSILGDSGQYFNNFRSKQVYKPLIIRGDFKWRWLKRHKGSRYKRKSKYSNKNQQLSDQLSNNGNQSQQNQRNNSRRSSRRKLKNKTIKKKLPRKLYNYNTQQNSRYSNNWQQNSRYSNNRQQNSRYSNNRQQNNRYSNNRQQNSRFSNNMRQNSHYSNNTYQNNRFSNNRFGNNSQQFGIFGNMGQQSFVQFGPIKTVDQDYEMLIPNDRSQYFKYEFVEQLWNQSASITCSTSGRKLKNSNLLNQIISKKSNNNSSTIDSTKNKKNSQRILRRWRNNNRRRNNRRRNNRRRNNRRRNRRGIFGRAGRNYSGGNTMHCKL